MGIIKNWFNNLFKAKRSNEPWLAYYSKEDRSIKFTTKSIYEYMTDSVGDDLDFYAINYFGARITYKEMFKHIDTISKSLESLGVKKGDVVTICMPNTPEAVEAFYAINKIGAVADMIHPLSAPNEIKTYLQQSKSRILILYDANFTKTKEVIKETNVYKTITVSVKESMPLHLALGYDLTKGFRIKKPKYNDDDYMTWKEFLSLGYSYHSSKNVKVSSKDLAIILHSGGTTGTPKGIMINNYNFNALAQQGGVNVSDARPKDKVMTILPIFHGFGLGVVTHCPLCLKVEVILIPEYDEKRFAKIIEKYRPQIIAGVPTLWEGMMNSRYYENLDLSSLKYVISGGDYLTIPMEKAMNKFLRKHGANISISKGYGMTESVAATAYTFDGTNEPGSIGIPMIGNSFRICDPETNEELPFGEEGEICVNGPTVMMGYFKNTEETKKVLRKHADGKVWLHTGDLGYISEDGIIYFTQRLKRVIISSGFNVYPSMMEEVIEKHPLVKRCCVIGIPHPHRIKVAKAFVVLNNNIKPTAKIKKEIRELCKKNLAAYSQPKEIEFREELPKTLYNKVDYKSLEKEEEEKRSNENK